MEDEIPDVINLPTDTTLNTNINKVKKGIPIITN